MIDGRSIDTPASGSIFWNAQDVPFEEVDRIEVIRGPGRNALGHKRRQWRDNLTTKSARETQGGLVSSSINSNDRAPGFMVRYGGQLAPNTFYRVYIKYFERDSLVDSTGPETPDDWKMLPAGFRGDSYPTAETHLTLQGDFYQSDAGKRVNHINLQPAGVSPSMSYHPTTAKMSSRGGAVPYLPTRNYRFKVIMIILNRATDSDLRTSM